MRDMFEVRCLATDYRSKTHNRSVASALGEPPSNEWDLKASGDVRDVHALADDAMSLEGGSGSAEQTIGNQFIKSRNDDGEAPDCVIELTFVALAHC